MQQQTFIAADILAQLRFNALVPVVHLTVLPPRLIE